MKRLYSAIIVLACVGWHTELGAQKTERRFSFAEMYLGLESTVVPNYGKSAFINTDQEITSFDRNGFVSPGFNFGATHFWGHADMYVSIAVGNINLKEDAIDNELRQRVFTGIRIYPLKISTNRLRPYIGYKFSANQYSQSDSEDRSSQHTRVQSILDVGLGYQTNRLYLYAGYNRTMNPDFDLYISRDTKISTMYPAGFFNVGVNMRMEITRTDRTPALIDVMERLESTNRYGFFFGAGPSSAFPLRDSRRISDKYPFLDQRIMPGVFPDISLGYHLTKWDIFANLAFRPISQRREAFDFEQVVRRNSIVLEILKGLADYHGFVPFVGMGVSFEHIRLEENDVELTITDATYNKITPILSVGWDIRPNKVDWLVLRTNLRYAPFLTIENGSDALSLQQLEFNFIQFVIYPGRKKMF